MRPLLLLILVAATVVLWFTLTIIREHATSVSNHVQTAVLLHSNQESLYQMSENHKRSLLQFAEQYGADDLKRSLESISPQNQKPELPEWVQQYVRVDEVRDAQGNMIGSVFYRLGFGGTLMMVPSWWFHGTFLVIMLLLIGLIFSTLRSTPGAV